ncbi:MAG TPA: type II toxin-antitoxin system VapC family toxin [Solirubrobacterales bacterium]|nr:type II toxin-antitoxin system VapC family toxin [Solirubrobacterales bacterium]
MSRETLIFDSSVVGRVSWQGRGLRVDTRLVGNEVARFAAASWAVSIVTIAEVRAGYRIGGWGSRRVTRAELLLGAFVPLTIDDGDIEEWSRLMAAARSRGVKLSDNDLWIAATASSRGHALVTCDRDHERIAAEMPVEVVYLAPPV